jgi:alpha-beta hydrolase superfamily lysophospholipase
MTTASEPVDVAKATPKRLIVYVPGIGRDHSDALLEKIGDAAPMGTSVRKFDQPVRPWSVRETPDRAAGNLDAFIERHARDVEHVVLIGHSLGGLIARSAWLKGLGYDSRSPSAWPAKLDRIVLLGVPNGGFKFRKGVNLLKAVYALATPFADFGIEHAKAGGYWVTNLRLRWLDAFRDLPSQMWPYVAEVIGVDDALVTGDDLSDSNYLPKTATFRLDDTDHAGLIDVRTAEEADLRWPTLARAIFGEEQATPPVSRISTQRVYFIFHGIRASADDDWVDAMREELAKTGARVVAPDTGYFSAFEFALPFVRNRKAHDFLEKYGDLAVTHDPDNFAFLGHSNGTYMMGRSMLRVPAVRFRTILLAGTVLNPSYDWERLKERRQVGSYLNMKDGTRRWRQGTVHNERARMDIPVGVLAAFLSGLKPFNRDVGPGGTVGFVNAESIVSQDPMRYAGGHSAALSTASRVRRAEIATFLKEGKPAHLTDPAAEPSPAPVAAGGATAVAAAQVDAEKAPGPSAQKSKIFDWIGRAIPFVSWVTVVLLAIAVLLVGYLLWVPVGLGAWAVLIVGGPLLVIYLLLRTV